MGDQRANEDFYRQLVQLLRSPDPTALLGEVLSALVAVTDGERGCVECYRDDPSRAGDLFVSYRLSSEEEHQIRELTSKGIVAAAISARTTVHTPFAMLDERFARQPSVQRQRIEAALCVPLGGAVSGVLFIEGRRGGGPFTPAAITHAEDAAWVVGVVLERLYSLPAAADPTAPLRSKLRLDGIAGRSPAFAKVLEQVALVSPLDITVMISGDSGTGKTQVARAIHDNSPRRAGPFVELNCAAIPEGLFESELFGTMTGAFTGARRSMGKVEAAEGGTLFLDEVGELDLGVQSKLLQLLQSKQYYALASTRLATANIRVLAASNANLEERVAARRFREDLFYRLNVFSLRMPSLAERREDIAALLEALLDRACFEHSLPRLQLSASFRAACESMDWPGNVRQLRNRLEQALIRAAAESAPQVEARHLNTPGDPHTPAAQTFGEATARFQRDLLRRALDASEWNVAEVARTLDLTRQHVYKLMRGFQLERSVAKGTANAGAEVDGAAGAAVPRSDD